MCIIYIETIFQGIFGAPATTQTLPLFGGVGGGVTQTFPTATGFGATTGTGFGTGTTFGTSTAQTVPLLLFCDFHIYSD